MIGGRAPGCGAPSRVQGAERGFCGGEKPCWPADLASAGAVCKLMGVSATDSAPPRRESSGEMAEGKQRLTTPNRNGKHPDRMRT